MRRQQGDDIRKIDWNVNARLGHLSVKIFEEERELTDAQVVTVEPSESIRTPGAGTVSISQLSLSSAQASPDNPVVINADGSMWHWGKMWPEYDGQGAFVTLVGEYYRYSKDKEFLSYNQFKLPQDYYFGKAPLRGR